MGFPGRARDAGPGSDPGACNARDCRPSSLGTQAHAEARPALFAVALSLNTQAQTLRWAPRATCKPWIRHSQNEIPTNTLNNHIYESLTRRDKDMRIVPALALEWAQSTRCSEGQAPPRRQIP